MRILPSNHPTPPLLECHRQQSRDQRALRSGKEPLAIVAAVFMAYLVIGLAMPVLPLHAQQGLGLGTFTVGRLIFGRSPDRTGGALCRGRRSVVLVRACPHRMIFLDPEVPGR